MWSLPPPKKKQPMISSLCLSFLFLHKRNASPWPTLTATPAHPNGSPTHYCHLKWVGWAKCGKVTCATQLPGQVPELFHSEVTFHPPTPAVPDLL